MKNVIIGILLIVSVALGGLLIQKNNKVAEAEARLKEAQKATADLAASINQREEQAAKLREKLEQSVAESAANAGTAAQLSVALTNRVEAEEKTNAKPANPLAEMFKNPEMRDMIKKQQKTVFATMIEQSYADFIKAQQLSPEQASALKELLAKKMAVGADLGIEMMSGDLTPEQRADLTKRIKAETDAIAAEIKDFLGTDAYGAYEAYEKSIPDRRQIETLKPLLPENAPLSADQQQQLLAALSSERQGFKFTTDFTDQNNVSEDMFSKFTEDRMNTFFQEQDQLNQKYLARAQTILSPEQYTAYQKSLTSQQEMMKMGMKMAASMFGTKKK